MNDKERGHWIEGNQVLLDAWKKSKLSKRDFMRKRRKFVDDSIAQIRVKQVEEHRSHHNENVQIS